MAFVRTNKIIGHYAKGDRVVINTDHVVYADIYKTEGKKKTNLRMTNGERFEVMGFIDELIPKQEKGNEDE